MKEEIHTWAQTNKEVCALLRQAHDILALSSLPGGSLKRKWVGLDADEVFELASGGWTLGQMAVLVEAKLKEKNT